MVRAPRLIFCIISLIVSTWANSGLAGGGLTADIRRNARNDHRIDTARAEDQLEISAVEGAKSRLVEKYVAWVDDKPLVEGR